MIETSSLQGVVMTKPQECHGLGGTQECVAKARTYIDPLDGSSNRAFVSS